MIRIINLPNRSFNYTRRHMFILSTYFEKSPLIVARCNRCDFEIYIFYVYTRIFCVRVRNNKSSIYSLVIEAVPRTWHMKPELHCNPVGVPAGALSPPATLSPPGSPSIITLPSSPWSPGVPGSSSSTIASTNAPSGLCQPVPDRFSAFTLVSNYNPDLRLQSLPLSVGRGKSWKSGWREREIFLQLLTWIYTY